MAATVKIVCGCNTAENPKIFTSLEEAEKHASTTGHTLHGFVKVAKQ